ncbi:hypothetical protein Nham_0133 [Nitrobacter hamburgensis X14]|uniref:Uncharacterized protein n=1 Tax=Nitrobacter hamburgensis (strain DSM 10229 / NCIMB 13809 / X14) TaxID=323097 RepID=Q1QRW3_NITHX|nr:hypothetical protein Nham_0133 [Nitrobacter hamburgensis X14]
MLFGWLPWLRGRAVALERGTSIPADAQNDLALILLNEFSEWYRALAPKGTLPRAFTGVSSNGRQAVIILADLPLDHVQRREFLIWLCRNEKFIAYAYGTRVGIANDSDSFTEGLDIYASSDRYDASRTLGVERQDGSFIQLTEHSHSLLPSNPANGIFFGLQRSNKTIAPDSEVAFLGIWQNLKSKVMWRQR